MIYLVDASVWLATDESEQPHHAAAVDRIASAGGVAALDLTRYEVANVAIRRWRSLRSATFLLGAIDEACGDRVIACDAELVAGAAELAESLGLSVYDAAYVAAARRFRWPLVSLDERDLVGQGLASLPGDALGTWG